jgi:hexosaminidase
MKARIIRALVVLALVTAFTARSAPAIIPLPQQMQVLNGTFTLCPSQAGSGVPGHATTMLLVDNASGATAQYLAALLLRSTGYQFQIATNNGSNAVKGAILLTTVNAKASLGAEGYELTVAPDSVVIRAPAQAGVFYGVQSLLQLLPPKILSVRPVTGVAWTAPCVYILDQPRFTWRGYMMDESRHFFGKQEVKKLMDAMALQKMNTFHWHLVDDSGWRIEILAYPLLTQVGAWRNGTGSTNGVNANPQQNNGINFGQNPRVSNATNSAGFYGGFYTQNDIREIVAYAAERHITIVPEIEMPAHCTSALAAYSQFGCGNPASTYCMDINSSNNVNYGKCLLSLGTNTTIPFLQEVLTEVMGLFPGQYIHCGGDEVAATDDFQWTTFVTDSNQIAALGITGGTTNKILAYQHWFSTNMANFLKANGRTMIGWSEFEGGGTVPNAGVMDWVNPSTAAITTAEAGLPAIMAPDTATYINYPMTLAGRLFGSGVFNDPLFEPDYNNSNSVTTLSTIYNFEPIPSGLPSQFNTNILGAECAEWAEYIPSLINEEFKAFPRMCAMAEVTWTPAASKNLTDFTNRLVTHEQRLTAMGINFDTVSGIQIGTWGPTVSTSHTTVNYTATSAITNAGDINVDFHYTGGANYLNIYSVSLLVNGVQVDTSGTDGGSSGASYIGFSGLAAGGNSNPNQPYFVLHLKNYVAGATYTIQAVIGAVTSTATSGTVYIENWN